jgi:hypothetical protein
MGQEYSVPIRDYFIVSFSTLLKSMRPTAANHRPEITRSVFDLVAPVPDGPA